MADERRISITNFRTVNSWFFRGGQPDEDQLDELAQLGIKTIICLRWNLKVVARERDQAKKCNFNFFTIPLSYWVLPTRKEIDRFFNIVDDPSKHPIFLHCLHGSDRTGMLVAIYRMARENWSADDAYLEMKAAGFHKIRMHQFKWAVYGFARRLERERNRQSLGKDTQTEDSSLYGDASRPD